MKKIIEMLSGNTRVSDWKLTEVKIDSYEMFFVHDKLETVRRSDTRNMQIEVYVDHDGRRGKSAIIVYPSTSYEEIERLVNEAAEKAAMLGDEMYSLPSDEKGEWTIDSNLNGREKCDIAAEVANIVRDVKVSESCAINALEIFVKEIERRIVNSRGIDKTQHKNSVMIEAIPTFNGEKESVELYEAITIAELDEKSLKTRIRERLGDVCARAEAVRPTEKLNCPVILRDNEVRILFSSLVQEMNMSAEYMKTAIYSVGDMLQTAPVGDKLNIMMTNVIKGAPNSSMFDQDGSAYIPTKLVDDGKVVAFIGSSRFAQYLGRQATGVLPCMQVESGLTSIEEMTKQPYLECVETSGLQVDVINDYIGGEIRLAYYFDGSKRIPMTGIYISGKLSEALNTIVLSKETEVRSGYFGPKKIKLSGMEIL